MKKWFNPNPSTGGKTPSENTVYSKKTDAEIFAESTSSANSKNNVVPSSEPDPDQSSEIDKKEEAAANVALGLHLQDAVGLYTEKSEWSHLIEPTQEEEEAKIKRKKVKLDIDVDAACAKCWGRCKKFPKEGLKGKRISIPKKLHISQSWRKHFKKRKIRRKYAVVVDGSPDLRVTYQELDEFSNAIAYHLRELKFSKDVTNLNPQNEIVIAVSLPACYEYVVVLLAVLKLGATFLPLKFNLPSERIAEIVKLTCPVLTIIASQEDEVYTEAKKLVAFDIIHVDDIWEMLSAIDETEEAVADPAILPFKDPIQNSNKGKPSPPLWQRSVVVSLIPSDGQELKAHYYDSYTILNLIKWENYNFAYLSSEHCLMTPDSDSIDFVVETVANLCVGATIVALNSPIDYYIPDTLFRCCHTYKIRRLTLSPTLLKACSVALSMFGSQIHNLTHVHYWIIKGGKLTAEMAEIFFEIAPPVAMLVYKYHHPDCLGGLAFELFQNVSSTMHENFASELPLGIPTQNTDIYILNDNLQPVPFGEVGQIYIAGAQLPRLTSEEDAEKKYYLKNPYSKKEGFKVMIRTSDYGRITRGHGDPILIHDHTRTRLCYVESEPVWLSHIDMYLSRLKHLIVKSYTVCYRPNQDDQSILAFCVLTSAKVSAQQVENEVWNCLPLYMIPEVVPVESIPLVENSDKPDENELLNLFRNIRNKRKGYDSWNSLGLSDPDKNRAAKILAFTIHSYIGTSIKEIMESYWKEPYLSIRRSTVTKATFIVKELHNNRYPIYVDDFVYASSLDAVIDIMLEARKRMGSDQRNCPPDEVHFSKHRYKMEIMTNGCRIGVCSLLARIFTARGQLDSFTQVSQQAIRKFFELTWPVFVSKKLSIIVRRKKETNKLVGAVLSMNWQDEMQLKTNIPANILYKLELIEYLEGGLASANIYHGKTHVMQICYVGLDPVNLSSYEIHGLTEKLIRCLLVIAKVKHFEVVIIPTFDLFTYDICVHNYGFRVAKECHVNQFVAADGRKPYESCTDATVAYMLWKPLSEVQEFQPQHTPAKHPHQAPLTKKKPWND